jgi:hypothetical protein
MLMQAERGAACSDEGAAEMQDLLPEMTFVQIRGSEHSIHRSAFQPFMEALKAFVQRCVPLSDTEA